jgi:uncharacterized coiled-coil protein SlyX
MPTSIPGFQCLETFFPTIGTGNVARRLSFWFGGAKETFMEDRLTKLEILYSDQGRMLEDLSREMYQQQVEVKRLTARIELLEEKLTAVSEANEIGGHERPPHY